MRMEGGRKDCLPGISISKLGVGRGVEAVLFQVIFSETLIFYHYLHSTLRITAVMHH